MSALPVAPSASKSPITRTRPRLVRGQQAARPPRRRRASSPAAAGRAKDRDPPRRETPRAAYTRRSTGCRSAPKSSATLRAAGEFQSRSSSSPPSAAAPAGLTRRTPTTAAVRRQNRHLPRALTLKHRWPADNSSRFSRPARKLGDCRLEPLRPLLAPAGGARQVSDHDHAGARRRSGIASALAKGREQRIVARRPSAHRGQRESVAPPPHSHSPLMAGAARALRCSFTACS